MTHELSTALFALAAVGIIAGLWVFIEFAGTRRALDAIEKELAKLRGKEK